MGTVTKKFEFKFMPGLNFNWNPETYAALGVVFSTKCTRNSCYQQ